MNTRSPFRTTLVGLAIGVLLALFVAPQSRWLVRSQLAAVGLTIGSPFGSAAREKQAEQRTATVHPNDYQLQIAARHGEDDTPHSVAYQRTRYSTMSIINYDASQYVAYLRTLTPRFGNNPSLYALLLRFQLRGHRLHRPEEDELLSSQQRASLSHTYYDPPLAPALLAAFDADAARGERLDPSNAFFPLMRAVGLFAAHRDAEGLAAVQRASTKPVWNEYLSDEVTGRLRLANAVYGHAPSISQIAVASSIVYPQYGSLREAARLATVFAVRAERAGAPARGMSIRRALMQDGDLMRVQATSYIGNLVGINMSSIAQSRPGGSEALPDPARLTKEQWEGARLDAFTGYAQRADFPEDAARAEAQYAAGETVHKTLTRVEDNPVLGIHGLSRLLAWWAVSVSALANVFWLLVMGVAGARLSRLASVRNRQPLPRAARWGAGAAMTLAVSIVAYVLGDSERSVNIALFLTIVAVSGLIFSALALRRDGQKARRNMAAFARAFAVTALVLGGIALIGAWQARGIVSFAHIEREITGLSGSDEISSLEIPPAAGLIAAGSGLIVPTVLAVALSIRARKRRVPVSAALASGFQRVALPLACVLVIGYGVAALGTLRQEQQMNDGLRQMIRHEGRYYASLAGTVWPGPA